MVKEIRSLSEYQQELIYTGLVVVDYFSHRCGPCRMIAPFLEQLSVKYPEVHFLKVDVDQNQDISVMNGIRAMPTFHFIVKGNRVQELIGANPQQLESYVIQYKVNINPFAGSTGHRLSDSSTVDPREARLRALGQFSSGSAPPAARPAPTVPPTVFRKSELTASELAVIDEELTQLELAAAAATNKSEERVAAPTSRKTLAEVTPVKKSSIASGAEASYVQLPVPSLLANADENRAMLQEMGFTDLAVTKALFFSFVDYVANHHQLSSTESEDRLERVLAWLDLHQEEAGLNEDEMFIPLGDLDVINQPFPPQPRPSSSTHIRWTDEIRAKKRQELIDKAIAKKEELKKQKESEDDAKERELRKAAAEKAKRERSAADKEKERIRAEIAREKELRKKNGGRL